VTGGSEIGPLAWVGLGSITRVHEPDRESASAPAAVPPPSRGSLPEVPLETLRHSTAHVMAQAICTLWPGTELGIGPAIEDGFYYDVRLPGDARLRPEDLAAIEDRMRAIVAADQPFVREELEIDEALRLFSDQPFKQEIIRTVAAAADAAATDPELASEAAPGRRVSVYRNGDFVDLCRGPHVGSTGQLGAFRLLRTAGAYWRGDERNPQLQRVYGTAFFDEDALLAYLDRLAEAEARDHRRLGVELDLFHFPPEIGSGLPVFHPKGALVRALMEEHSRRAHLAAGYELAWTPHLAKATLFEASGHLGWYAESMYPPMELEGARYYLKPMNCPMHTLIYESRARSYRELPLRLFEFGTVYRYERSGVLHGLTRVRGLTQDDAHIFTTPEGLADELRRLLAFVVALLRAYGLTEFEAELSTRPEKFIGEPAEWEVATDALRGALEASGLPYDVAEGEGAFYAPKVDVHLRDAIGRRWQVSTLQVDLQLPRRFDLSYIGPDNERHRPWMVHRALFGSVERFLGILLEHYAGALPAWLAPVQVQVVPVASGHATYAEQVASRLRVAGHRVEVVSADETLGARIRRGRLEKIPWILVVGETDVAAGTVGVNRRGAERPERDVPLERLVAEVAAEAAAPSVDGPSADPGRPSPGESGGGRPTGERAGDA